MLPSNSKRVTPVLFLTVLFASQSATAQPTAKDIRDVPADLQVPQMTSGNAAPGMRVKQRLPGYPDAVYHALYLPTDWNRNNKYPIIVELAGNGPFTNPYGDVSTGYVEGSKLGYGIASGQKAIWLCAPFVNNAGSANVQTWWGNEPDHDAEPTVTYLKKLVPFVCENYGGDANRVLLTGFSRGAIACNYIGLHDDEIASLWKAMILYSHYDGVHKWSYPESDTDSAKQRLKRLGDCPQLICSEVFDGPTNIAGTRKFIASTQIKVRATYLSTGFRNHNDAWILRPSDARRMLRLWVNENFDANTATP
ncbi:MAG: hypothetical protein KDB27_13540 [Planctomycetales bacterium]|nr:hypothetical protein [Planctomycetales bacterium]